MSHSWKLRRLSVQQVLEAMEENGYRWYRGGWILEAPWDNETNTAKVGAACIMQQAAFNLKVHAKHLYNSLNELDLVKFPAAKIVSRNDDRRTFPKATYSSVLRYAKSVLKPYLDKKIEVYSYSYDEFNLEGSKIKKKAKK